ncbi:MAG: putative molybdenum carrier protein [Tatlockia sp.]|nr:putative molybdenum carrier protein [Tatlockia sp.]
MIKKILSGGQTGVDQAALLIAQKTGITIGGWCPKGGCDENGKSILIKYSNLKETKTANPKERTKLNIHDSDGTLVIVPNWPLEKIKDGTVLTIDHAKNLNKPCLIISLNDQKEADYLFIKWIEDNNIEILNIAGPRESNSPGIFKLSCELLLSLLGKVR